MKLEDIVKQKGLEIKKEEKKPKPSSSPSNLGRRYFWDEDQDKKPTNNLRTNLLKTTEKPTNLTELVGIQRLTFLTLVKMARELGFLDNSGNRITPQINGNEFAKTFVNRSYKQTKDTLYHFARSNAKCTTKIKRKVYQA